MQEKRNREQSSEKGTGGWNRNGQVFLWLLSLEKGWKRKNTGKCNKNLPNEEWGRGLVHTQCSLSSHSTAVGNKWHQPTAGSEQTPPGDFSQKTDVQNLCALDVVDEKSWHGLKMMLTGFRGWETALANTEKPRHNQEMPEEQTSEHRIWDNALLCCLWTLLARGFQALVWLFLYIN